MTARREVSASPYSAPTGPSVFMRWMTASIGSGVMWSGPVPAPHRARRKSAKRQWPGLSPAMTISEN